MSDTFETKLLELAEEKFVCEGFDSEKDALNAIGALVVKILENGFGGGGSWAALTGRPANLVALGNLADAAGVLTNDGVGNLSYTGTSTGGNAAADAGKIPLFGADGSLIATVGLTIKDTLGGFPTLTLTNSSFNYVSGIGTSLALGFGVPTGVRSIIFPDASGTVALTSDIPSLAGYAQLAAANNFTTNGAASTPSNKLSGTWFTGGSATTTKPQFLIEPAGTPSTAWSINGTGFGINADAGFTGRMIDYQLGGASVMYVTSAGQIITTSSVLASQLNATSGYIGLNPGQTTYLYSGAANTLQLGENTSGSTPAAQLFRGASRVSGADGSGGILTLSGGNGLGGVGGSLILATYDTAGAATAGTLVPRITIDTDGGIIFDPTVLLGAFTISPGSTITFFGAGSNISVAGGLTIGLNGGELLGFFGATPITQPARPGQLTDNSGGTSGGNTIAVIGVDVVLAASQIDTANAIATLGARLNAIEVIFSGAASGLGLYA